MQRKRYLLWGCVVLAGAALIAAAPRAAKAYKRLLDSRRQALIDRAREAIANGDDSPTPLREVAEGGEREESESGAGKGRRDDPTVRRLANLLAEGVRGPDFHSHLAQVAARESRKRRSALKVAAATDPGTRPWFSLGPQAARSEWNGTYYKAVDSGRLTAIKVDPNDQATVYIGSATGGLWVTNNFGQAPQWRPLTEELGDLAVGAVDIDPNDSTILYLGVGEAFDQGGGYVVKSTDSGDHWSDPVPLVAPADGPTPDGFPSAANDIRDLRVDPTSSQRILVTTNDGLYRSTDGGQSFVYMDLPNAGAYQPTREATWSLVYLGATTDQANNVSSSWLVTGVYACPLKMPPSPSLQGGRGLGSASGCRNPSNGQIIGGNFGDIWRSTDSGATWTSIRAAGGLPSAVTASATTDVGRIALGASFPFNPSTTVVYAEAGSMAESGGSTAAIMQSTDGGNTWTKLADKNTPLSNPTFTSESFAGCQTMNLGHGQSF